MKKILKFIVRCPVLAAILVSWGILAFITWEEGKMPIAMKQNIVQNPVFAALMSRQEELPEVEPPDSRDTDTLIADLQDPDTTAMDLLNPDVDNAEKQSGASDADVTDGKGRDAKAKEQDGKAGKKADGKTDQDETVGVTKFVKYKKVKTDSPYYSDPGVKALTTEYTYEKVAKDYFDDAVFIGDSRTVGMQDYSGLNQATFFAKTGMNVYEILDDNFIKEPSSGKDVSVSYMFKHYKYKKIYLMIGINELGTGNTGTFQKAYARVLQKIRKWQPDAVIYIQGIIPVSKKKAESDAIFNNININDKNVAIAQLADGKNIFYLDVSEKLTDKEGFLKEDYTFDDVHMYAQHYQLWTDYLMGHAVVRK